MPYDYKFEGDFDSIGAGKDHLHFFVNDECAECHVHRSDIGPDEIIPEDTVTRAHVLMAHNQEYCLSGKPHKMVNGLCESCGSHTDMTYEEALNIVIKDENCMRPRLIKLDTKKRENEPEEEVTLTFDLKTNALPPHFVNALEEDEFFEYSTEELYGIAQLLCQYHNIVMATVNLSDLSSVVHDQLASVNDYIFAVINELEDDFDPDIKKKVHDYLCWIDQTFDKKTSSAIFKQMSAAEIYTIMRYKKFHGISSSIISAAESFGTSDVNLDPDTDMPLLLGNEYNVDTELQDDYDTNDDSEVDIASDADDTMFDDVEAEAL